MNMENVTTLATAATSYFTVRSRKGWHSVALVTPAKPRDLETIVAQFPDRDQAIEAARRAASRQMRPFRMRGTT